MNLKNLTNKELCVLRCAMWYAKDMIYHVVYNYDVVNMYSSGEEDTPYIAYYAINDLCIELSKELKKRGVEE